MVCGCPPRHHSKWRRLRQRRFWKAYTQWRRRQRWTSCQGSAFAGRLAASRLCGCATLIFDAAGNLYGTTLWGGTYGDGTVFELTPTAGGGWTEQVLYSFGNGTDGADPNATLIFYRAGNLYGTTDLGGTYGGGTYGLGTVFEVTPIYPCVFCNHVVSSGEGDVPPAERRDMPEQGGSNDGDFADRRVAPVEGTYNLGTVFEVIRNHAKRDSP